MDIYEKIITHLNKYLEIGNTPEWMAKGRTCLILKDRKKGYEISNFRVREKERREKLFLNEQKGCRRQSRGTKDQLILDKMVIKNCKKRMTNLNVAWIDYKKAYNMIPHTWILQYLKIFKVANMRNLIEKSMKTWKVELT